MLNKSHESDSSAQTFDVPERGESGPDFTCIKCGRMVSTTYRKSLITGKWRLTYDWHTKPQYTVSFCSGGGSTV